jgi:hypothetical protein
LIIYHPYRGRPEFNDFQIKVINNSLTISDLVELAARDPRLQADIGRPCK